MTSPPRPHPLSRSGTARWADRAVEAMWSSGMTEKPPLDPDFLWAKGSAGFVGDDEISCRHAGEVTDFRDRLERLCRSLRKEADLNALGHTLAYGQLTTAIRRRHALGRIWRERPNLGTARIAPPIVIVGQMRSGTTRLHRLLAADPRHSGTRFCNAMDPVPASPDLRAFKSGLALMIARRINPWLDTLHPFGATRIDEEIAWLSYALDACTYEAQWRIPSFVAFNEAADARPVYREFARTVRSDAAAMGDLDRPRVLKVPQFAENLTVLLEQFPDARLVVSRRNPAEVLESSVSMVASQMAFQSDTPHLSEIRKEWARKIALREERMASALERFDGRVSQVDFEELNADWRGTLARVYRDLELPAFDSVAGRMESEMRRAEKGSHRGHRDQMAGFAAVAGEPAPPA